MPMVPNIQNYNFYQLANIYRQVNSCVPGESWFQNKAEAIGEACPHAAQQELGYNEIWLLLLLLLRLLFFLWKEFNEISKQATEI